MNMYVGWVPRRSMDTNQPQILQGHGPPHPAYSSDLRHTSQFPHHSTSNLCTCHPLISDGTRELVCRLGTQTLDGHQPTTDSSRTWTSSPCLLIGFEAHFPVSSSQHFKLMYMSSFISDGTRELVCRLGTQTLDGHQPTTDSSRSWTSSPCLLIGFEAHFPVSSSQHFKLMYMSSSISDGTREHVCRLGTQTLDGHQPTTDSLRPWTSSSCLPIGFEAHFPVSSSQHFKLWYMSSLIAYGTREHVCRLGTQTLNGHQPTTDSLRSCTSSPFPPIRFEAHFHAHFHACLHWFRSDVHTREPPHVCTDCAQTYTHESDRISAVIALRRTHKRATACLH